MSVLFLLAPQVYAANGETCWTAEEWNSCMNWSGNNDVLCELCEYVGNDECITGSIPPTTQTANAMFDNAYRAGDKYVKVRESIKRNLATRQRSR